MEGIKEEFVGKFYWCSVDESTDRNGRCIANLIVGVLDPEKWHSPHLIAVKPLTDNEGNPKVDNLTVGRFVNASLGQKILILTDIITF
jgi:hypothetical protein